MGFWLRMALWQKVMIGLVFGLGIGLALRESLGVDAARDIATTWFKPWGDAFIRLIRMLVVPLIFTTLVAGVLAMGNPARLGKLGFQTLSLFFITTLIAVGLGLVAGTLIQPGTGFDLSAVSADQASGYASRLENVEKAPTLVQRLLNIIPENPVAALASGDVLPIIFFAILFGVGILMAGEAGEPIGRAISSAAEAVMKLTMIVMETAPFGVLALMTWVMADQGLQVLVALGKMTGALYLVCAFQIIVVFGLILVKGLARLPMIPFLRGMSDAMAVAFSTASSNATLPVTITCVTQNLGVKKSVAGGVLALGATVNMNGTAAYQGLIALFAVQALGMTLVPGDYVMIMLLATLVAIGTAGIPGVSLFLAANTLTAIGVPPEQIVLIIAVLFPFDRILDMARTVTNITGDAAVATVIGKWEGELDEAVYRARDR
jgi:Na+/H+-dicarboxylate symporter